MKTVPQTPTELVDETTRRRIEDHLLDYAHAIDDDHLEAWPDFFTDDALYRIVSRESFAANLPIGLMHCQGRGMLVDRIRALRRANIFEPHVYCHILAPSRITPIGDQTFEVRTNVQVLRTMQNGETDIFASGKYLDRVHLDPTTCRLTERIVVLDSRRIEILLVVPL